MMKILDILRTLDCDALISDGADTWEVDNLYNAIMDAADEGDIDDADYDVPDIGIYRIKADGYRESVPDYTFETAQ